jgi:hypothetical protein
VEENGHGVVVLFGVVDGGEVVRSGLAARLRLECGIDAGVGFREGDEVSVGMLPAVEPETVEDGLREEVALLVEELRGDPGSLRAVEGGEVPVGAGAGGLAELPVPVATDSCIREDDEEAVRAFCGRGEERVPEVGLVPVAEFVADDEVGELAPGGLDVGRNDVECGAGFGIGDGVLVEDEAFAEVGVEAGDSLEGFGEEGGLVAVGGCGDAFEWAVGIEEEPGDGECDVGGFRVAAGALDPEAEGRSGAGGERRIEGWSD